MNKYCTALCAVFLLSCTQQYYYGDLTFLGKLPHKLNEVSGIVTLNDSIAWVIEDNGNKDHLYAINLQGKLVKDLNVKSAKNNDWEDLAKDGNGNLFIGDFGNNYNHRKNLAIYKVSNPDKLVGNDIMAEKIEFNFPEQANFPPSKEKMLYDCEAFFYWNDFLYLITKNRTKPFSGKALVYKVPAKKGHHIAELIGDFVPCLDPDHCSITSATISPDGQKIILLGYGFLWVLTDFTMDDFSKGVIKTIDTKNRSQMEAICFLSNGTLLIADEQSKTKGRNLYSYKINCD
ncbi:MAG: hypothetical protein AAGB24_12335 [Bacteroidota bacterium]